MKIRIKKSDIRGAVRAVLRERLEEQVHSDYPQIEDVPGFAFPLRVPFEFEIEEYGSTESYNLDRYLMEDMSDPDLINVEDVRVFGDVVDVLGISGDPQNPDQMSIAFGHGVIAFLPEFFENAMLMLHHPSEGVGWSWNLIEEILNSDDTLDYLDERFASATGTVPHGKRRYSADDSMFSLKLDFKRPGAVT